MKHYRGWIYTRKWVFKNYLCCKSSGCRITVSSNAMGFMPGTNFSIFWCLSCGRYWPHAVSLSFDRDPFLQPCAPPYQDILRRGLQNRPLELSLPSQLRVRFLPAETDTSSPPMSIRYYPSLKPGSLRGERSLLDETLKGLTNWPALERREVMHESERDLILWLYPAFDVWCCQYSRREPLFCVTCIWLWG